jgi:hypothetical protein
MEKLGVTLDSSVETPWKEDMADAAVTQEVQKKEHVSGEAV